MEAFGYSTGDFRTFTPTHRKAAVPELAVAEPVEASRGPLGGYSQMFHVEHLALEEDEKNGDVGGRNAGNTGRLTYGLRPIFFQLLPALD